MRCIMYLILSDNTHTLPGIRLFRHSGSTRKVMDCACLKRVAALRRHCRQTRSNVPPRFLPISGCQAFRPSGSTDGKEPHQQCRASANVIVAGTPLHSRCRSTSYAPAYQLRHFISPKRTTFKNYLDSTSFGTEFESPKGVSVSTLCITHLVGGEQDSETKGGSYTI